MGEEVMMTDYEVPGDGDDEAAGDCCEEDRVLEWEMGLPSCEDLTPLSQSLVPPELALAFSISPERSRTIQDVNRASQTTLSALRNGSTGAQVSPYNNNDNCFKTTVAAEEEDRVGSSCDASDTKKQKKSDDGGGSTAAEEGDSGTDDPSARALKRPRLVWTPQLHKRFVDVVAHLGIKNAVPKTIMQLMNVEGLTRENVASHLQKYRLYLKRMQGLTTEDPSSSDHLLSSKPVPPQSFHDGSGIGGGTGQSNGALGHTSLPMRVPYGGPPPMMPMPMPVYGHMGMQGYHHHHHHHHHHATGGPGVFESNPFMMQQKDWPGNKYGSMASYPSVGGGGVNDK